MGVSEVEMGESAWVGGIVAGAGQSVDWFQSAVERQGWKQNW